MPKVIIEHTDAITLVMTKGQLLRAMPWITKKIDPKPSIQKVGIAMPSVLRVRIVAMACGR